MEGDVRRRRSGRRKRSRTPKHPGRKKGSGDSTHSLRKPHLRSTERVVSVDLLECCPGCGSGDVGVERTVSELVEDLPVVAVLFTRFDTQIGRWGGRGQKVHGRHPDPAADTYGAAGAQIGPRAVAFAAYLHKGGGLSLERTATMLKALGLEITRVACPQAFGRWRNYSGGHVQSRWRSSLHARSCCPPQ